MSSHQGTVIDWYGTGTLAKLDMLPITFGAWLGGLHQ